MDGIDAALIRSDGESHVEFGPAAFFPYPAAFRREIEEGLEAAKAIVRARGAAGRACRAGKRDHRAPCRCRQGAAGDGARGMAQARHHRLPRPDRAASPAGRRHRATWRRRGAGKGDRNRRRLRHARQRHEGGRAGRAAGACLSRGARPLAAAAICRYVSDRVRQYRRHLQHHLCRRERRSDRLRHRARQCADRPVGGA